MLWDGIMLVKKYGGNLLKEQKQDCLPATISVH
jgi:hypothetical protein